VKVVLQRPGVAIVGFGAAGHALAELFPDAFPYDEPKGIGTREEVNSCAFAFICVPTPAQPDGRCDTTLVEEAVAWLDCDYIVICSTVEVGTTRRLRETTGKRLMFQPLYGPGETVGHPFRNLHNAGWIILGGERDDTVPVADLYKHYVNAEFVIQQTTSETAELCKYMENAFLATKVAFCNEFYDLAALWSVDYNELRELWLLDPRIGRSHTFVLPDSRGFGGKCLPKDLTAIVAAAKERGRTPLVLQAVIESNLQLRQLILSSDAPTTSAEQTHEQRDL
jgi:UDPglucose 6-dehydrogenase